ncbi:MAG: NRDE family protein [Acidobacteriales bacterium]|nr:NRDE family protein [Terriglobales bacterium]
MCTVTFIPRDTGFLIAMNRDERLTREAAQPPQTFRVNHHRAIFPHESSGGTWIGANDSGMAFAILNQSIENGGAQKKKSRGAIIPALLTAGSSSDVQAAIHQLDFAGTLPFRLLGFFPAETVVREWTWNGKKLESKLHPWQQRHWFSSGKSDEMATQQRGAVCQSAWRQPAAGSLSWVRRLHRSHLPERGAFSICVHRDDAQTVSYSELSSRDGTLDLRYRPGSPCGRGTTYTAKLRVRVS